MKIFLLIAVGVLALYNIILTCSHFNLTEQLKEVETEVQRLTMLVDNLSRKVNLLSHPEIKVLKRDAAFYEEDNAS